MKHNEELNFLARILLKLTESLDIDQLASLFLILQGTAHSIAWKLITEGKNIKPHEGIIEDCAELVAERYNFHKALTEFAEPLLNACAEKAYDILNSIPDNYSDAEGVAEEFAYGLQREIIDAGSLFPETFKIIDIISYRDSCDKYKYCQEARDELEKIVNYTYDQLTDLEKFAVSTLYISSCLEEPESCRDEAIQDISTRFHRLLSNHYNENPELLGFCDSLDYFY